MLAQVEDAAHLVVPGPPVGPLLEDGDVVDELERGEVAVEARLLRQEADRGALGRPRFSHELLIFASHDSQQRALAAAIQAEHADLRAGKERQPDVPEHLVVGRVHLPEPLHRVDVLSGHRQPLDERDTRSADAKAVTGHGYG